MKLPSTKDNNSLSDISPNELKLRKLDRRDTIFRLYLATLLTAAVVLLLFVALYNRKNIEESRKNIEEHRERNETVHLEIENYIRCVVLLRYNNPPITPASSRAETEAALDKCAAENGKPKSEMKG